MKKIDKSPTAVLDYGVDWEDWLAPVGDSIEESTWVVEDGISHTNETVSPTVAGIWLSGGTTGTTYTVTNHIKTVQGREDSRITEIYVTLR